MEIEQPAEWVPSCQDVPDALVITRLPQAEPPLQTLTGTDVIPGEDMNPSQAAEQHVLGRPTPNAPQLTQSCDRILVIELHQRCQINLSRGHATSQLNERTALTDAVAERSEFSGLDLTKIFRARKRMAPAVKAWAKPLRQTIEQDDPDRQAQLLAGDPVRQRFKQRGKAGRLQTTEFHDEPVQSTLAFGEGIESVEADRKTEELVKRRSHGLLYRRSQLLAADGDVKFCAILRDAYQHRPLFNHEDPLIRCSVPVVHGITGTAAQGPRRQIETEWQHRLDRELPHVHEGCIRRQWRAATDFDALPILTASLII
jgi:hypothetical protein